MTAHVTAAQVPAETSTIEMKTKSVTTKDEENKGEGSRAEAEAEALFITILFKFLLKASNFTVINKHSRTIIVTF